VAGLGHSDGSGPNAVAYGPPEAQKKKRHIPAIVGASEAALGARGYSETGRRIRSGGLQDPMCVDAWRSCKSTGQTNLGNAGAQLRRMVLLLGAHRPPSKKKGTRGGTSPFVLINCASRGVEGRGRQVIAGHFALLRRTFLHRTEAAKNEKGRQWVGR